MIHRRGYRAQAKKGREEAVKEKLKASEPLVQKAASEGNLMTLTAFMDGRTIFIHEECIDTVICPMKFFEVLKDDLETFAGEEEPRYFAEMTDVFHYNRPVDDESWRRKTTPDHPFGMTLRLQPEKISSYIFYHHQLQEEKPGEGDKYGMIWLHENLMLHYLEVPEVREKAPYEGKLHTHNSPENWQELMQQHFLPWDDGTLWKPIDYILYVG